MSMIKLAFRDILAVDALAALIVHWIYNKYEVQPIDYIPTTFLLAFVPALPTYLFRPYFTSLFKAAAYAYSTFHATLISSIVVYRISPFHPLAKFPGPPLARLSKLWGMWLTATGKQHKHLVKLHEKYGPFVRIGPNELSCIDANAITPIMGANGLPKGPIWDARTVPGTVRSLIALRDIPEHRQRRKPWTNAFNTAAIKDYEPIIVKRSLQLAEILEEKCKREPGKAIDMSTWMSYFVFDFMGDMAFGGGFELMSEGDKDGIWDLMKSGLKASAVLHHIPWIMPPLWKSPQAIASIYTFFKFTGKLVNERLNKAAPSRDLFHHLFLSDNPDSRSASSPHISYTQMITDSILAMVAGSDTTAIVMCNILFFILSAPPVYKRLQAEIDTAFPRGEGDALDGTRLAECVVLNAVINEAMRLQPPVPSGSNRGVLRGSEGKQIGSRYIPPGSAIFIPTHTIQRSPAYFSPYPNTFWPDRWLPEEQREPPYVIASEDSPSPFSSSNPTSHPSATSSLSRDSLPPVNTHLPAYIPFSTGPANCAGKNLAMVEMRMVIALLVQRFEMRFEEGYDIGEWEASLEEWFLLVTGKLPIVFERR